MKWIIRNRYRTEIIDADSLSNAHNYAIGIGFDNFSVERYESYSAMIGKVGRFIVVIVNDSGAQIFLTQSEACRYIKTIENVAVTFDPSMADEFIESMLKRIYK